MPTRDEAHEVAGQLKYLAIAFFRAASHLDQSARELDEAAEELSQFDGDDLALAEEDLGRLIADAQEELSREPSEFLAMSC